MSQIDTNVADKQKKLDAVRAKITKDHGKQALVSLKDRIGEEVPHVSTGSLGLDIATGIGGLPLGKIVEIYGPESSGKTTLTLHVMAEAQKLGHVVGFIDMEHAFDPTYADAIGVQIDDSNFQFSQPDYGEQALDIAIELISSGVVSVVVIDSVAALTPKAEIEADMEKNTIGLQARMLSQAMRKIASLANKNHCLVIFINQIREKIGVMFGSPETTPGGNALKFFSSMRFDIRRIGQIKDGESVSGNRARVKVIKNKLAPPFRQAEFDIMFGEGISKAGEVLDLAVEKEIMKKSGSWYSYNGGNIGQGKDSVVTLLRDNEELMQELEAKVLEAIKPKSLETE